MSTGDGTMDGVSPDVLTHASVMDGSVKYKILRKIKLQVLCGNLLDHTKELELREAVSTDEDDNGTGTGTTSNGEDGEDNVRGVEEGDINVKVKATSSEAKTAKLAKLAKLAGLVKLAKSTNLWCLSPYVPMSQEARDKDKQKQRKVCPVNLQGEVWTADNCGSKHPEVCHVADHSKGKIPKATCTLWHMRIPRGNSTGNNSSTNNAQTAKPDKHLTIRLEA
jgi:hypothetical protein